MAKISIVLNCVNELINDNPGIEWTVRQIYYRLVSPPYQIFPNRRSSYVGFDKQLVKLRECGDVDDYLIVDSGRTTDGGDWGSDESVDDYFIEKLEDISDEWENYSLSRWDSQNYNIIVVLEKDALSRLVGDITDKYRIALAVGKGYSSRTQILSIIEYLKPDKENVILYLGDFDPTGLDIERSLEDRLNLEGEEDLTIERIALTYQQAKDLPPNPTKMADTRTNNYRIEYGNQCWELDAIPPKELQNMIQDKIKSFIDWEIWNKTLDEEEKAQEELKSRFTGAIEILKEHYDIEQE